MSKSTAGLIAASLVLVLTIYAPDINGLVVPKPTTLKSITTTNPPTANVAIGNPRAPVNPKPDPIPPGNMKYNPKGIVFQFWQKGSKPNTPMTNVNVTVANFSRAPFNANFDTKIMVHGFISNPRDAGYQVAAQKYHNSSSSYNVILVDWSVEAAKNFLTGYPEAREDTEWVGDWVNWLIQSLIKRGGTPAKFHCIGHSLGSHVCNYAAMQLQNSNFNMSRVTCLDPANPVFEALWAGMRGHAVFTDIIHTTRLLSRNSDFGDVDFYPNDGHNQPGCPIIDLEVCDHGRAVEFFVESISSNKFMARNCDTWDKFKSGACATNKTAFMGDKTPKTTKGRFFLETNPASPFAKGTV